MSYELYIDWVFYPKGLQEINKNVLIGNV